MCGCGCELGLVLAACQLADVPYRTAPQVELSGSRSSPRLSWFERVALAWMAALAPEAAARPQARTPLQNLSRGRGR